MEEVFFWGGGGGVIPCFAKKFPELKKGKSKKKQFSLYKKIPPEILF